MTNKKYNGWTNWETWNCNLHFDGSFDDHAQDCWDEAEADSTFSRDESAALALKDIIEEIVREYVYQTEGSDTGLLGDMVGGYLSEVNWYEIAQGYIGSVDKESEAA
jgi:hypothetical protein